MATEPEGGRYEFDGNRVIFMVGGTRRHSVIGTRFVVMIGAALDLDRFEVHGPDRGVETLTTVRYLDAIVTGTDDAPDSRWTTAPVLIVDVLSPSSTDTDLGHKVAEYVAISSLLAYVVADPLEPRCRVWKRSAKGAFPKRPSIVEGPDAVLRFVPLGLEISLADIYRPARRTGG
jgi:Uma2 family endonuclease